MKQIFIQLKQNLSALLAEIFSACENVLFLKSDLYYNYSNLLCYSFVTIVFLSLLNGINFSEKQSVQFGPILHRNGSFTIATATKADEGSYLCEASNGIGAGLSSVITLSVNGKLFYII